MRTAKHPYLLPLATLIIGLGLGGGATYWKLSSLATLPEHVHIHLSGYRYINPLLECSLASSEIEDLRFKPLKHQLQELIEQRKSAGDCEQISLYFRRLQTGDSFGIDSHRGYEPASILKIPVMIGWLKRAEKDPKVLQTRILYDGSRDLTADQAIKPKKTLVPGIHYTVEELISRMIADSDNNAWALLVNNIDISELAVIDKDLDLRYGPAEGNDITGSVRQLSSFFRVLYNATYLNREMSEKALGYLTRSSFVDGIAAGVPRSTVIAGKFGERTMLDGKSRQLHDFGIVYHPKETYLLCIMSRGTDFKRMAGVIRDISRVVYDEMKDLPVQPD